MKMNTNSNLALIPARGGSKGILKKNIKMIAGKPLIAWSIEQALRSSNIDRVVVSTDCTETADIAKIYGAEVPFIRPGHLATDKATTEASMSHALLWLKENQNYHPANIVLLQATSPVRKISSIDQAFKLFHTTEANSLVSVCEFWHFLWENKNFPKPLYDHNNRPRRQDIPNEEIKLKENGSIYITDTISFLREHNRLCGKIVSYLMSEVESFEIDNSLDWFVVEGLLNNYDLEANKC
jgi:CMP-N,N'-diacetyllegionaminic acid synthase